MEKLKELFSKAQIKYIVSVDDCYQDTSTPEEFSIKENMVNNNEQTCAFFTTIHHEDFAATFQNMSSDDANDYLDAIYPALSRTDLELYVDTYMKEAQTEVLAKNALQDFFENLKASGAIESYVIQKNRYEAQQFFNNLESNIDVGPNRRVLWMIDKDFSSSGESADTGIELIKNFISSHKANNIYALTSAQLGGTTNDLFRSSISEHISQSDTLLACIVDKHNITEKNYLDLYNQISHGFRQNYSATITKELRKIFSNASENANTTIESFGDDTLHKVFFESGRAEGVSAIEVFQRLLLIIIRGDIVKQISEKYDDIARLIHDYAQLCNWCGVENKDYPDYDIIKKARISECYDQHINSRYSPVVSGDIFAIAENYYILLGQLCNLTIREDGERKAQCATLAKINKGTSTAKGKYQLNYFQENEIWTIDYNDCINVDFSVLDLCALNSNGSATLPDTYFLSEYQYRYTDAIRKKLESTIKHNRDLLQKYRSLSEKFTTHSISFEEMSEGIRAIYKDNCTDIYASFESGITYTVSRWGRISTDLLEDILKNYSEYHSRKGLQHDFAKEYKTIPHEIKYDICWEQYGVSESDALSHLITQYVFYQSGAYEDKKLKETILEDFCIFYSNQQLPSGMTTQSKNWKYEDKTRIIAGSKDIPVCIGDDVYFDVLRKSKNGNWGYRIPTSQIPGLKVKHNKKFTMGNDAELTISNGVAMFAFPDGIPHTFYSPDALELQLSFHLNILHGFCLEISKTSVE